MTTKTVEPIERMSELLESLGSISPERVLLRPMPGTATEEDLLSYVARTGRLCELVDGVLVEKPMGFGESLVAGEIQWMIRTHLAATNLGAVVGEAAMMRLTPGLVRAPDVSFIRWDRIADRRVPMDSIGPLAPDLAVEVLSPGNTKREMAEKRQDLFAAGTRLIWIMDPRKKTVSVYRTVDECRVIESDGCLDGEDVLPGFSLTIREWFETATGER